MSPSDESHQYADWNVQLSDVLNCFQGLRLVPPLLQLNDITDIHANASDPDSVNDTFLLFVYAAQLLMVIDPVGGVLSYMILSLNVAEFPAPSTYLTYKVFCHSDESHQCPDWNVQCSVVL